MVLILAGLVITGFAVHHWRRTALPRTALRVPGVVTDVSVRETTIGGTYGLLYGPTVEFVHPLTTRPTQLPPEGHDQKKYAVGDHVEVACDPSSGRSVLVPDRPLLQKSIPLVFGLVVIGLGILDLAV